jgi:hypothetical protein
VPVIEGAGGVICDWSGAPLTTASGDRFVMLGNPARLPEALDLPAGGRREGERHAISG